jgi:membrane protease YdiL (CAAX protease family)
MTIDSDLDSEPSDVNPAGVGGRSAAAGLLALTLVPLGQVVLVVGVIGSVLAAIVLALGVRAADRSAVRLATLTLVLALIGSIGLPFAIWFAVAAVWLWSRAFPQFAPTRGWLPAGTSSPILCWLTGGIVLLAGGGLTVWSLVVSDPGQGSTGQLIEAGQGAPGWAIALFVVIFVPVNAVTEEVAYRGIAFESATRFLPVFSALVAQALAFGTLHVAGFPSGLAGIGLAFGYGIVIGLIRQISGGLRFPVIAHMAADATIAVLVILLLLPG